MCCQIAVHTEHKLEGGKSKGRKKKLIRKDCKRKAGSGNESDASMVFSY